MSKKLNTKQIERLKDLLQLHLSDKSKRAEVEALFKKEFSIQTSAEAYSLLKSNKVS